MGRTPATILLGFVLALAPGSARSDVDSAEAIVATGAAAAVLGMVCGLTVANVDAPPDGVDEYARRGWQIGVAGRYAVETFTDDLESDLEGGLGSPASLSSDDSAGISGRLGYRCHRRFSVEAEVEWLAGFDADVSLPGLGKVATVEVEPVVVTINVKGRILTGRYQPFLLVGVGLMTAKAELEDKLGLGVSTDERETDFAMRLGGGIDLYVTKHVVVSAETQYVLPFGEVEDLDYVSIGVGLEYRF